MRISDRSGSDHVKHMLVDGDTGIVTSAVPPPARDTLDEHDRGCGFHPTSETDDDEPLRPARGIVTGLLISLTFWLIIGVLLMIWLGHWAAASTAADP